MESRHVSVLWLRRARCCWKQKALTRSRAYLCRPSSCRTRQRRCTAHNSVESCRQLPQECVSQLTESTAYCPHQQQSKAGCKSTMTVMVDGCEVEFRVCPHACASTPRSRLVRITNVFGGITYPKNPSCISLQWVSLAHSPALHPMSR